MTPTLETKLVQLVNYLDRRRSEGALQPRADQMGQNYLLDDPELSAWLDKHRAAGIPTGPFIDGRQR